jgi:hypothetical protein
MAAHPRSRKRPARPLRVWTGQAALRLGAGLFHPGFALVLGIQFFVGGAHRVPIRRAGRARRGRCIRLLRMMVSFSGQGGRRRQTENSKADNDGFVHARLSSRPGNGSGQRLVVAARPSRNISGQWHATILFGRRASPMIPPIGRQAKPWEAARDWGWIAAAHEAARSPIR